MQKTFVPAFSTSRARVSKLAGSKSSLAARRLLAVAAGVIAAPFGFSAMADTFPAWTGGGNDNNFLTAANWSTGVVPTIGDTVIMNDPAANGSATTVLLFNNPQFIAGMAFTNTATTNYYSGTAPGLASNGNNNITITNGITVASNAGTVSFGNPGVGTNVVGFTINGSQTIQNLSAHPLSFNGATSNNTFAAGTSSALNILTIDGPGDGLVGGSFADQGSNQIGIVKNGAGNWELDGGSNKFTGGVVLNAGTLGIKSSNAFNSSTGPTNSVTINGGTLAGVASPRTLPSNVTFAFGGDFQIGNAGAAQIVANGAIDLKGGIRTITVVGPSATFNGAISNGGLTKSGTSTLTLGGASAYTGRTTIDTGNLNVSAGNLLSPNSAFTVNGLLNLLGNNQVIGSLAGTGTVTLGSGRLTTGNDNTTTAFSGIITSSTTNGSVVKIGSGMLSLNGTAASTFTGDVSIGNSTNNAGVLSASQDFNLGSGTNINITNGTLLGAGTFTIARTVKLNNAASTIDATSGNMLTLTGSFTGSGDFNKGTSAGTVQLAQTSALTFPNVTANGGTLNFGAATVYNNSNPNGPVVTSGGLANALTISGALTINNGSTVALNPTAPGSGVTHSVGSLSVAASSALDIGNHGVLVQSAADETVIQHYLERGYAGGFWNGRSAAGGSITSVTAFNDNSGATSVGFGNSADFTGTSSPYAPSGSNALTGNQVIVKTALAGDLLLRGGVGANELSLLLNSYGTKLYDGVHPNTWAYGNIDYSPDGTVGANDLSLLLGNYGKSQGGAGSLAKTASAAAVTTLTSSASDGAASPSVAPANGIELDVYPNGDVKLNGNNAGAVTAVNLASASGALIGGTNFTPEFNALFPTTASNNANQINPFNTATNGATVNGLIDMGVVFNAAGLHDLTFQFSQKGINRGGLQDATVVYVVPEPTSLCTIGLAAAGLLGRRKRKAVVA